MGTSISDPLDPRSIDIQCLYLWPIWAFEKLGAKVVQELLLSRIVRRPSHLQELPGQLGVAGVNQVERKAPEVAGRVPLKPCSPIVPDLSGTRLQLREGRGGLAHQVARHPIGPITEAEDHLRRGGEGKGGAPIGESRVVEDHLRDRVSIHLSRITGAQFP